MDPHDWNEKYYTSKREDELDQQLTAEARTDFKEQGSKLRADFTPLFCVPIDDFDTMNYCIL